MLEKSNPTQSAARDVALAAKIAVCQSSAATRAKVEGKWAQEDGDKKGKRPSAFYDCWRFATAPQTITQIKCMGERRSGSRFIKQLISLNVDVELLSLEGGDEADAGSAENGKKRTVITRGKLPPAVDRLYAADYSRSLGWRHACAPTQSQFEEHHVTSALLHRTLFVFVAKNPYAWLVSLYNSMGKYRDVSYGSSTSTSTSTSSTSRVGGSGTGGSRRSTFEDFTRTPWVAAGAKENIASCQRRRAAQREQQRREEAEARERRGELGGVGARNGYSSVTTAPHHHPDEPDTFLNPMVMWNQKHRSYLRVAAPYTLRVRYEVKEY
jgi:hypothetical protein